ncbi:MAG: pilus assembly protein PilM, partial [Burkholderiales bacterium]
MMKTGGLHFNTGLLERLFKPPVPPLIGADISSSGVKLIEISAAGKSVYRIERYVIEPLPRDAVV